MSDTDHIRWCPACQQESLDGDERFCANCCKVLDQLFPDGAWHNMETEDLVEHYHSGLESVGTAARGISPVEDMNAPKEEGAEGFWKEWGSIIVVAAVVVIGLLIYFFL